MAARPSVVVLDYGFGNVRSAVRAMQRLGSDAVITADAAAVGRADGLIVPGVGAFSACMAGLAGADGPDLIARRIRRDQPVLGICVGMQVMFDHGVEHGHDAAGLGYWPGVVERLDSPVLPHMGWNMVEPGAGSALFAGLGSERFYFVHSYGVRDADRVGAAGDRQPTVVTTCDYGGGFVAAVEQGPLSATQFHPEKSGDAGMHLLGNWMSGLG